MVSAWYMDIQAGSDQRDEQKYTPNKPVSLEELRNKTGVEYFPIHVDGDSYDEDTLKKIREDRGYSYQDHIEIARDTLPDYDRKLKNFFEEHLHSDEEIRFCLKGSGYFDVRDMSNDWIRVELVPGDLIILPAGIYHRFTLDHKNYIKAMRFFVGEPVWTPFNRPADDHPARVKYLSDHQGFQEQTQQQIKA